MKESKIWVMKSNRPPSAEEFDLESVCTDSALTCVTFLSSIITPSLKRIIRLHIAAISSSWVTIKIVFPSPLSCCKNAMISLEVVVSKAPVGSSAKSSFGSEAKARAMATRCFCPPDNSLGKCVSQSKSPTFWRWKRAFSWRSFFHTQYFYWCLNTIL